MKTILKRILIGIALFFVILYIIPIKYALQIPLQETGYVCYYQTATEGNWYAGLEDNPGLTEPIFLNVYGTRDFMFLKEIADLSKGVSPVNKYVFYGMPEQREISKGVFFYWLKSPEWDIAYPIHNLLSRSYLTVYDYDWGKVISYLAQNSIKGSYIIKNTN